MRTPRESGAAVSELFPYVWLLGKTLVLTVIIELAAAIVFFGVRTCHDILVVVLAQVVTNPSVELLCLTVGWRANLSLLSQPWLSVLAAELAAWAIEALLYRFAGVTRHPWLMSAVLNGVSFGLGLVLAGI